MSLNDFQDGVAGNHHMTSSFAPQMQMHTNDFADVSESGPATRVDKHKPYSQTKRKRQSLDLHFPPAAKKVHMSQHKHFTFRVAEDQSQTSSSSEEPYSAGTFRRASTVVRNAVHILKRHRFWSTSSSMLLKSLRTPNNST